MGKCAKLARAHANGPSESQVASATTSGEEGPPTPDDPRLDRDIAKEGRVRYRSHGSQTIGLGLSFGINPQSRVA